MQLPSPALAHVLASLETDVEDLVAAVSPTLMEVALRHSLDGLPVSSNTTVLRLTFLGRTKRLSRGDEGSLLRLRFRSLPVRLADALPEGARISEIDMSPFCRRGRDGIDGPEFFALLARNPAALRAGCVLSTQVTGFPEQLNPFPPFPLPSLTRLVFQSDPVFSRHTITALNAGKGLLPALRDLSWLQAPLDAELAVTLGRSLAGLERLHFQLHRSDHDASRRSFMHVHFLSALTRLTWLRVGEDYRPSGPLALQSSWDLASFLPSLTNLQSLAVDLSGLGSEGVRACLGAVAGLPRLRELHLPFGAVGASMLPPSLPLTHLSFQFVAEGDATWPALARTLPGLESLEIGAAVPPSAGPLLAGLRSIRCRSIDLTGVVAGRLRYLELRGGELAGSCSSEALPRLRHIRLLRDEVGSSGPRPRLPARCEKDRSFFLAPLQHGHDPLVASLRSFQRRPLPTVTTLEFHYVPLGRSFASDWDPLLSSVPAVLPGLRELHICVATYSVPGHVGLQRLLALLRQLPHLQRFGLGQPAGGEPVFRRREVLDDVREAIAARLPWLEVRILEERLPPVGHSDARS